MQNRIIADQIITPFYSISRGMVVINPEGIIKKVTSIDIPSKKTEKDLILEGMTLIPGFIDIHTHGGYGVMFGEGDFETDTEKYSLWAAGNGVTGFLLSITGPNPEAIKKTILDYVKLFTSKSSWPGAVPLGLHLEGPFLNPDKHGAFDPGWLHVPSVSEIAQYLEIGGDWIKQVSLAPELEGAEEAAEFLSTAGVTVAMAHSNADYETARNALIGPFSHVTHTFNAQSSLHHRAPGVIGAILASDGITGELIGDGIHVHPAVMKILFRCIGAERVVLITDAMPGAGLPDGKYQLMGREVTVENGKATLPDGTIAGSAATMRSCVETTVNKSNVPLPDAVRAASYNPALVIRESDRVGSIETGKEANFTVLDNKFNIFMTIVKGKIVYKRKGS